MVIVCTITWSKRFLKIRNSFVVIAHNPFSFSTSYSLVMSYRTLPRSHFKPSEERADVVEHKTGLTLDNPLSFSDCPAISFLPRWSRQIMSQAPQAHIFIRCGEFSHFLKIIVAIGARACVRVCVCVCCRMTNKNALADSYLTIV